MKKTISLILAASIIISLITFNTVCGNGGEPSPCEPPLCSDWAEEGVSKAARLNITDYSIDYNYLEDITREQFCELIYNYIDVTGKMKNVPTGNPFTDTDNFKIYTLFSVGIIKGKTESIFAPQDLLTREEAATILLRLIEKVHPDWAAHQVYYVFEDEGDISDWAMRPIQTICNMGIMKGVGDNKFAPKANLTTEQAIVAIIRVYDAFNREKKVTFADGLNMNMLTGENYMFSPFSIKTALVMAANGAEGLTKDEILRVLDIDDLNAFNEKIKLMSDKYSESDILRLNTSNSVWINSDKTEKRFSKDYINLLSKNFGATADVVTDKNTPDKINGWVNEKTEGKIPQIITEDNKDFEAMLVNAVYFNGRWESEFHKSATEKDVFTSRDGKQTEIDFMNKTSWINYALSDGVLIVELPYLTKKAVFSEDGEYLYTKTLEGIDVSMYLMMSDRAFMPEETLNRVELSRTFVSLSVPKFKVEYTAGIRDILKLLGINKAFERDAEFGKMFAGGNMYIDSVLHKTYINVDEEGTEAAAVTAMAMAGSALPPEPVSVKLNKPFTFVIRDNVNGEILFMGEYAFAK